MRTGRSVALLAKELIEHLADGKVRATGIPEDGTAGKKSDPTKAWVKKMLPVRVTRSALGLDVPS